MNKECFFCKKTLSNGYVLDWHLMKKYCLKCDLPGVYTVDKFEKKEGYKVPQFMESFTRSLKNI